MSIDGMDWLKVAQLGLLSRAIDELEETQLAPQGQVKYQFSSQGHELVQVLLAETLDHPHDAAAVYYRSRPFMLACGLTALEALAADMARTHSPSEGRDVGVVYNRACRSGVVVLPSSGDVGAQYTPAVGWAQSIVYRQRVLEETDWSGAIAAVMGGDGSLATNGFWASLVIATTLNLPVLYMIEDNRYGLSVPVRFQTPGGNIAQNLASFNNLEIIEGDGTEPRDAWEKIRTAVSYVRTSGSPCLLHMHVVRLKGHTFIDDQSYKSADEKEQEQSRDPLGRLRNFFQDEGIFTKNGEWDEMVIAARRQVADALANTQSLSEPDPEQVTRYVYYEGVIPQVGGLRPENVNIPLKSSQPVTEGPRINFIDAVRRTLESEMKLNPRMMVFGEDVGVKGGVHGATLDLQLKFGADRVFDTSLSEEGIIGRSVGMALAGLLPVPEIQFRKYADPAYEQINDLGTLRWRTANKFGAPVVVRIPVGFGKKVGDPWHSVTAEAIYAHQIGWRIAFPSNAADAAGLLRTALRGDDPTFFFEHRALLDTIEGRRPYPGDEYCLPFGRAVDVINGDSLTVITWGAMVHRCLLAAQEFPGRVSVIDLRTISPWDQQAVLSSIHKTGKALVVHEDTRTAGFAGEIIAIINELAFTDLDAPVLRLSPPDVPIPYSIPLMEAVLPGVGKIKQAIGNLLAY